jgi:hypothetical protein
VSGEYGICSDKVDFGAKDQADWRKRWCLHRGTSPGVIQSNTSASRLEAGHAAGIASKLFGTNCGWGAPKIRGELLKLADSRNARVIESAIFRRLKREETSPDLAISSQTVMRN